MGAGTKVRHSQNIVDKPERIGPALAQVIGTGEDGREVILGQCWVGAPNQLITCGHVVDRYVDVPEQLFVYFPASGKKYQVQRIRLHPSFVRQPDGLVKFDAAVLTVHLSPPDSLVMPLPFCYENAPSVNQALWTIRYPVHLGQLSAALQPLSQDGHFLGLLRKHDNFHLLHDVPLAPGDSGAPISDGRMVVAMHCGDTGSIPGLNLPTSSIRMALWVDALRDLGLPESKHISVPRASRIAKGLGAFAAAFAVGLAVALLISPNKSTLKPVPLVQPNLMPLEVKFNEPLDAYSNGEVVEIFLVPRTPCYAFMFLADQEGHVVELYPGFGRSSVVSQSVKVDQGANKQGKSQLLVATDAHLKLYCVAVDSNDEVSSKWAQSTLVDDKEFIDKNMGGLSVSEDTLLQRIKDFQAKKPGQIFWHEFDMPRPRK